MSTTKEQTMIIIPKSMRSKLEKRKLTKREPYYAVIERLLERQRGGSE